MDLKECGYLSLDPSAHWYYSSKFKALKSLLPQAANKTIIDVGAGDGFFGKKFLETTDANECYLIDINYESEHEEEAGGKKISCRRNIPEIPVPATVLLIDVVEHIEDDAEFLKNISAAVPMGSDFLITVPAFPFLWSGHDEFLEHKRRYTLHTLEDLVKKSGLHIRESGYFFAALLAPAIATRVLARLIAKNRHKSQMFMPPQWLNTLLSRICTVEIPLMRHNRLAGLSVFCLARK